MKVTFETDDVQEFERLVHATDMAASLWEIQEMLRRKQKQLGGVDVDIGWLILEGIREEVRDILRNQGIDLERLYS